VLNPRREVHRVAVQNHVGHTDMLPIGGSLVKHERMRYATYRHMAKKNPAAVALGKRTTPKKAAASAANAKKAVKARMKQQTPEERSAQAKKAAAARWGK
jgi:hypothetical protein